MSKNRLSQNPRGAWRQCAAAALALFCAVGLNVNVFSLYLPYITELCRLTHSQAASFATIRSLFCCLAIIVVRRYYLRLDIRLGYTLAVMMSVLSYGVFCLFTDYRVLCIGAVLSGLSFGFGGMYPASILIHRWFLPNCHEGLALGICSAATGLACTVFAPPITFFVERFSVQTAILIQILLMTLCALLTFALIRNYPDGSVRPSDSEHIRWTLRPSWMFACILAIGALGILGYQCVPMHYTCEGFLPYQISVLVSLVGLALTVGKFFMGALLDRWGAFKTNRLFFALVTAGCVLFIIPGGFPVAILSVLLYGLGNCMGTVGLTAYAEDLSSPEEFAGTLQLYQFAYPLGALLFGQLPGLIADHTGSYRLFFAVLAGLSVFSFSVIQLSYRKKKKTVKA